MERKDRLRAIECTLFRNESGFLSSELIVEACAAVQTWALALNTAWPDGLITGVSTRKTSRRRSKRALPGECYRRAGWVPFAKTTKRADVWLRCAVLPAAERPQWDGPVSVPKARAA